MGRLAVETFKLGDNQSLFFGDAGDATFTYDGTDLVIDPQAVGSGKVKINGNIALLGSTSGILTQAPAAITTDYTITWPAGVAGAGEVLTDAAGNGVLSWAVGGGGLSNIVEDITPELGGNLDCLNNSILNVGTALNDWTSAGIFLGDDTNTDMTIGITINQGANDDHIMTFKSSDVNHPMTAIAEADTYGWISKASGNAGGLAVVGIRSGASGPSQSIFLIGYLGEPADSTHTTSGKGIIHTLSAIVDGGTGTTAVDAAGNIFTVDNNGTAEFIVDGAGNLYANAGTSTAAVTVFDDIDDVEMVRAFDLARTEVGVQGLIRSRFDEYLQYNEDDLVEAGILGAPLAEGGLINITRLQQLHNGAIWQLYGKLRDAEDRVELMERRITMLTEGR